jgi:hypothetical protein
MEYSTKPVTLQELQQEIEQSCAAMPAATWVATCQSAAHMQHLTQFGNNHCLLFVTSSVVLLCSHAKATNETTDLLMTCHAMPCKRQNVCDM